MRSVPLDAEESSHGLWGRLKGLAGKIGIEETSDNLGDFTTNSRVIFISTLAILIGVLSAFVALVLLRLIGLFTNLFYFQRWDTDLVSPSDAGRSLWMVLVPIIGGLAIGLTARYGSERIRGHGIPEAIEAILINGSRVEPRVAILKPISSAVSIGSGGPFGAEGPIIMTGGAFGSLIAQFLRLTASERKTLLVAGAAAGMSATFATPIAAVLLAFELLLFEWKPRSLVPVAIASVAALIVRRYILGFGPLFPTDVHPTDIGLWAIVGCLLVGLLAGIASLLLTAAVYASEDAFLRLPIHWMWWPAIGGLIIGVGGLIYPGALGVGYVIIEELLSGNTTTGLILGVLIIKSIIWAGALGSGTSGGVLAPLLMIGGALGALMSFILPDLGGGFWPLVSMGAILGGTMRSPFTGTIFAVELTHDINMLVPVFIGVLVAHSFTVLTLRRSILTEKVARRGFHLSREYSIDPLEILSVREVMRTNFVALPASMSVPGDILDFVGEDLYQHGQRLYPVVNDDGSFLGVVPRSEIEYSNGVSPGDIEPRCLTDIVHKEPVIAYPDEPLRYVVNRMAHTGLTSFPVVDREDPTTILGVVSLYDLLKARVSNLEAERRRERVLPTRAIWALRSRGGNTKIETNVE